MRHTGQDSKLAQTISSLTNRCACHSLLLKVAAPMRPHRGTAIRCLFEFVSLAEPAITVATVCVRVR
eukprot:6440256-Amphidinium_carterae.1